MGFSVTFSPFLIQSGSTGSYGLEGEFTNLEPSKKPNGTPYQFSDISTDGSYYFIDTEGNIFPIVLTNASGPNSFPYIEVDNLVGEMYTPQVADGLIAVINPVTMQFYVTSTASKPLRAKVQRINVRDLVISGGNGVNIYNADGTITGGNRSVNLGDNELAFTKGLSEVKINANQLKITDLELEIEENFIQKSLNGSKWLQTITDIGSTVKTKL